MKIEDRIRNLVLLGVLKIKFFRLNNSIIIFSEKRGGSTWLAEILEISPKIVMNWEPLHENGSIPKFFSLGEKPYLPKSYESVELKDTFIKIVTLKLHSRYTRIFLSISALIKAKYVLTKFVSANMICEWLIYNLNFKRKPIFLVRNPIDCCSSQLKTFSQWINEESQLKLNNSLNHDRFIENMDFLIGLDSMLERQIAIWCLNNIPAINSMIIKKSCTLVFYEDLLMNTESELKRILKDLNLPNEIAESILNNQHLSKPSFSDFKKDLRRSKNGQLKKNLDLLSQAEKDKIQKLYDYFDFKLYSAYSPFPRKEILDNQLNI